MRMIIPLICSAVFVLSTFSAIGICINIQSIPSNDHDVASVVKRISIPDYKIIETDGKHVIKMDGYSYLSESGKPLLPSKTILIALPPDALVESVYVNGLNIRQIPGFYNIIPASKVTPACPIKINREHFDDIDRQWVENYELTYSSDDAYPNLAGELVSYGTFHKISYISVSVYPFTYHPASGRLFTYDSAEIKVNYRPQKQGILRYNVAIEKQAYELFSNYDQIKHLYQSYLMSSSSDDYGYVIITSSNLYDSVISSNFVTWKSKIGFTVRIMNITDSLITSQQGFDLAEQIRNFLRKYYVDWGIEYVLFVGNYTTIPMRYCFPNCYNHEFNLSDVFGGEYPTDSYYADLSYPDELSWDSDGDGFYGEYRHDNPDFLTEISVGRIPTNDGGRVVYVLEKIMAFEMDTGEWKNNVLHAGAILQFPPIFDDGAKGIDYIEKEVMSGKSISHYSEQEGVKISEYPWKPLTEETFIGDWATGKYGVVNWFGHGWANKVCRWVWVEDSDGDSRPDSDELVWKDFINVDSPLDDDYPSILICKSCVVGYPETCPDDWGEGWRGNLGVDLLIKPSFGGAVAVMSATRVCYLINDWVTGNIIFEFNKQLLMNHESVGDAFFNAKFYYCQNCTKDHRDYCNKYGYNLYGDPSLVYEGITAEGKPYKPIVSGPESGKVGEEYTYAAVSVDPDDDNLYLCFNWGDSTDSGWLGPSESGSTYNASHAWSKKGTYEVKVRVKDVNGLISEWSDPLSVSMPRNNVINRPFQNFLQNHPFIFHILRVLVQLFGLQTEDLLA